MDNNIEFDSDLVTKMYEPVSAIVIYKSDGDSYIEHYPIANVNGKFITTGAKPLNRRTSRQLFSSVNNIKLPSLKNWARIIDNDIHVVHLFQDYEQFEIIWIEKPQSKHLEFSDDTEIQSGTYNLPGLIFSYSNSSLKLYAYHEKEYLKLKRKNKLEDLTLYKAPFVNMRTEQELCHGNHIFTSSNTIEDIIDSCRDALFSTRFNHSETDNLDVTPQEFYKYHNENNQFNLEWLVKSTKKTLRKIL